MTQAVVDIAVPGAIAGRLLTAGGEPVRGVPVNVITSGGSPRSLPYPRAHTDEEGRYHLEGLTPGPATVRVYAPAYARMPDQETTLVARETVENVDFVMLVGGQVSGTVRRRDGKPLTHQYRVGLYDGPVSAGTRAEPDGTFRIEHVHPGSYELRLSQGRKQEGLAGQAPRNVAMHVLGADPGVVWEVIAKREGITVVDEQTAGGIEFVVDE
jgi:hypothetical protein